jgi:hypothetical protein
MSDGKQRFLFVWRETLTKLVQIILQSRVHFPVGMAASKKNKFFNIDTDDLELISSELQPWMQQTAPRMLGVEIYAIRRGSQPHEKHKYVLERWKLEASKGPPSDPAARIELPKAYKSLIVLIRSVYVRLRLLPAFELFRRLQRNRTLGFSLGFHLYSSESDFLERPGQLDNSVNLTFQEVCSEFGSISLSVDYLPECPRELLTAQPSMKSVVINDFIGERRPSASDDMNSENARTGRARSMTQPPKYLPQYAASVPLHPSSVMSAGIPISQAKSSITTVAATSSHQAAASAFTPASYTLHSANGSPASSGGGGASVSVSPPLPVGVPIQSFIGRLEQGKSFKLSFSPFKESPPSTQFVPPLHHANSADKMVAIAHSAPSRNHMMQIGYSGSTVANGAGGTVAVPNRERAFSDQTTASMEAARQAVAVGQGRRNVHHVPTASDDEDGCMFQMEGMSPGVAVPPHGGHVAQEKVKANQPATLNDLLGMDDEQMTVELLSNGAGDPLPRFMQYCAHPGHHFRTENVARVSVRDEFARLREVWKRLTA